MAEGNNHIKLYTAEEIQSYLDGRMTAEEMHALERAALEDAFLADAIDGYSGTGTNPMDAEESLRRDLQDRLNESGRNRIFPGWLKIAAAIAVLVTTVVSITLIMNPDMKKDVIVSSQKEPRRLKDTSTPGMEPATGSQQPENERAPERKQASTKESQPKSGPQMDKETSASQSQAEQKSEDASAGLMMTDDAIPGKSVSRDLKGKVSGVVIDSNKRPVPGAVVSIARQQVVTDEAGLFALKPTDTVMNIEVQSAGFATRNAVVKNDSVLDTIVLSPSTAPLEEVVVVGYGTKKQARKSDQKAQAGSAVASPSIPWDKYHEYISSNLKSSGADTIPGEAVISFSTNADGILTRFKVDKGAPTDEMDAFLIDLIKKGPKWRVTGGKTARGTVRIELGANK